MSLEYRLGRQRRTRRVTRKEILRYIALGRQPFGAATLVWDHLGRVLLVRKTGERWVAPGGFSEPGESPDHCAQRKVWEEAGVAIELEALTTMIEYCMSDGRQEVLFWLFQFEADYDGGKPRPGRGFAEVAWFDRLPGHMRYRADYVEPWNRRRPLDSEPRGVGAVRSVRLSARR